MSESISRLWELLVENTGQLTTGGLILRAALICCSVFATVQLLSMLATRYGDHHATSKSFFLSLLLHCCFALGWASAVGPRPRPAAPGPVQASVSIKMLSTGGTAQGLSGLQNGWGAKEIPEAVLTRFSRPLPELPELDLPESETSPAAPPQTQEVPILPTNIQPPQAAPQQELVESLPSAAARPSTEIDQPTPESRPEVNTAESSRQKVARAVSSAEQAPGIEPQRGAAEKTAPVLVDGAVLTLPNQLSDPLLPKIMGAPDDLIRRRSSPDPVQGDTPETGSSVASSSPVVLGDRRTGKFTRAGSRTGSDDEFEPNPPVAIRPAMTSAARESQFASRTIGGMIGSDFPGTNPKPELARIEAGLSENRSPTRDPEAYRSRRLDERRGRALQNGGSEDSERAVEASLRWMANNQEPAGNWSSARHGGGLAKTDPQGQNRLDGGLHADSGITGLVVLSFLGAGYTHEEGKYADVVRRALKWLIAQQSANGYLGGKATRYDMMYCHAMATFALAEAYGMQSDPNSFPELQDAVQAGVRLICAMQNDDGGWRYGKGGDSDMSMFGWQLMALKSAVQAGIPVPDVNRRGMTKFLQARALGTRGGLAGYKLHEAPSPAMTAEALFCRQMFGVSPQDAAAQEATVYLGRQLPRLSNYDEYYWYYGTLAMFQQGGEPWQQWNDSLRDTLVGLQRTQGPLAGSWDPNGKWAGIGGRVYSTAVSTMCLEVYYRFLRIYQSDQP